ncbi:uncharacterized protein LOC112346308 [Selaginella moellendorffii]|uniref:uncharacterized protein LOC112346308 n=1 Tax=Selaginella moellendorffii TaxID=88036 RepID=UPI000D1C89A9|nr:uncharacterized protein LOC112346308 [Selaginella moellendorffii]|eukprot:XP_024530727.1 uncharacterized protein LOC112346308 [Selaginella moellendorffii]
MVETDELPYANNDDSDPQVMAVQTRAQIRVEKQQQLDRDSRDSEEKGPESPTKLREWKKKQKLATKIQRQLALQPPELTPEHNSANFDEIQEVAETILNQNIQITVGQLLKITPYLTKQLTDLTSAPTNTLTDLSILNLTQTAVDTFRIEIQPGDCDNNVPTIELRLNKHLGRGAIIDGGSSINIIEDSLVQQLNISPVHPTPFNVQMADHRSVQPKGIIRKVNTTIQGVKIPVNYVLKLLEQTDGYSILLGQPWLRTAQVYQDWPNDNLILRGPDGLTSVSTKATKSLSSHNRPIDLEEYNLEDGLDDYEEQQILKAYPDLKPLAEIDLFRIVADFQRE